LETAELLEQFEVLTGKFPREAVEAAFATEGVQREELTLELLRVLAETLDDAEELASDGDYMAHFYAMYLLAQFRETRAYPLVIRIALLPSDLLEELCGDFATETLGRVLASVCRGELAGIKSLIENPEADEWARGAGIGSLVTLVVEGEKSREEVLDYFGSLFRGGLERQPSAVWMELVAGACDLWPQELMPEIEQAIAAGLIEDDFMTMEDVRYDLARGLGRSTAFDPRSPYHRFIRDTVKDFGSWACFQPQKAVRDRRTMALPKPPLSKARGAAALEPLWNGAPAVSVKVGRNEPCPCGSGKKYKKCCLP
jgi:uncharacterized protein DUF1186/SEC-C motif-containing protein